MASRLPGAFSLFEKCNRGEKVGKRNRECGYLTFPLREVGKAWPFAKLFVRKGFAAIAMRRTARNNERLFSARLFLPFGLVFTFVMLLLFGQRDDSF